MRSIYIAAAAFVFMAAAPAAHAAACIRLSSDMSTGSNDITFGGQVRKLQDFLVATGHMSATPNGNYGPATTAAVKKYQDSKGIPATGTVGPLTRFAIEYQSCAASTPETPSASADAPSEKAWTTITRPRAGETVNVGKAFSIKWAGSAKPNQVLVLEDEKGVAQGYITSHAGTGSEYLWSAGEVSVSGSNSSKRVPLGNYRIRLQDRFFGKSDTDPVSGVFLIGAQELEATTLLPSSVKADGKTAVVLYGSGLFGVTMYLGEWYQNPTQILYSSDDGSILVFTVPESTPAGKYSLVIRNQHGAIITSTIKLNVSK